MNTLAYFHKPVLDQNSSMRPPVSFISVSALSSSMILNTIIYIIEDDSNFEIGKNAEKKNRVELSST